MNEKISTNAYPSQTEKISRFQMLESLKTLPVNGFLQQDTCVDAAWENLEYLDMLPDTKKISKSKIRSMYSELCDIAQTHTAAGKSDLSDTEIARLRRLRIRIVYDMGRDSAVMMFVEKTHILAYLVYVEKCRKHSDFTLFCKYFAALIAFHRFMNPNGN